MLETLCSMKSISNKLLRDDAFAQRNIFFGMASEHLDCAIIAAVCKLCDDFAPGIHTSNEM